MMRTPSLLLCGGSFILGLGLGRAVKDGNVAGIEVMGALIMLWALWVVRREMGG